jgi:hypothetical protein
MGDTFTFFWEAYGRDSIDNDTMNESVSDVFGSLVKQAVNKETANEADWLIGEGLFIGQVQSVALRSMSELDMAYDDPVLGKDPQPAHMSDYVRTIEDNAGVHITPGSVHTAETLYGVGSEEADAGSGAWDSVGVRVASSTELGRPPPGVGLFPVRNSCDFCRWNRPPDRLSRCAGGCAERFRVRPGLNARRNSSGFGRTVAAELRGSVGQPHCCNGRR